MKPWRRWRRRRWARRYGYDRGHAFDMQHFMFRWLVGTVLVASFIAAHLGFFSRDAGLPASDFWVGLVGAMFVFWFASGHIAKRLIRPMAELTDFARSIGEGNYEGRTRLSEHRLREVRVLASTLNDMAIRIERQLRDQRELLAAISHELRSPLSRMRVLLELAHERGLDDASVRDLEDEVVACDRLIGIMLASSRLDFSTLELRPLDAQALAKRALERAALPERLLAQRTGDVHIAGDPTLLAQALANLLDNATRHGQGATALVVEPKQDCIEFSVEDAGQGFQGDAHLHVFDSFYRKSDGQTQGLGLGLSLVKRIAVAHGGRVWAENRTSGGARVGFSVSRKGSSTKQPV